MAKKPSVTLCPCGSGLAFDACCGRFLSGASYPETAEQLMRSRYSAYVKNDMAWIAKTWAKELCPTDLEKAAPIRWLGLEVKSTATIDDAHATVDFVARGRNGSQGAFRLRENSLFEKRDGRWVYVKDMNEESQND